MARDTFAPVDTSTAYPSGTSQTTINQDVAKQETLQPAANARPGERSLDLEAQNREKMLASGELKADTNPQIAQEKINLFTYGVENPTFGPTLSSDATRDRLATNAATASDSLKTVREQKISNMQPMVQLPTPEYQQYQDFTDEFSAARTENKTLYQDVKENIQKDFDLRAQEQRTQNRLLAGQQAKQLAKMGALGTGASGMSFLQQVDQQNQLEISKILTQKEQTLLQATEAAQAKDTQLLEKLIKESHDLTDQYNKIQTQRLEDSVMTNDQIMEQNRFGWDFEDRAAKKLSDLAAVGQRSSAETTQLEVDAGLPAGYFDNLSVVAEKARNVQDAKDALDLEKSINEIRNATPEGQSFKIGDTVYKGWKKEKPVWESLQMDDNGNGTIVYYDSETKSYKTTSVGKVGSAKDGWDIIETDNGYFRRNIQTGVVEPLMVEGGALNPKFLDGFSAWSSSVGEEIGDFESNDGVHQYVGMKGDVVTAFTGGGSGRVIDVHTTNDGKLGRYVKIQGEDGKIYTYSNLGSVNVQEGQSVEGDEAVGTMGELTSGAVNGKDGTMKFSVAMPSYQIGFEGGSGSANAPSREQLLFNNLANGMGAQAREQSQGSFEQVMKYGSKQQQRDYLLTTLTSQMTAAERGTFDGYDIAFNALETIDKALKAYVDMTGDTGIFAGKIEDLANYAGLTSDPQLAGIKTMIDLAVGDYVKAQSGLTVNEEEREMYLKAFPSIAKSPDLNQANIEAVLNTINAKRKVMVQNRAGADGYQFLFEEKPTYSTMDEYRTLHPDDEIIFDLINGENLTEQQALDLVNSPEWVGDGSEFVIPQVSTNPTATSQGGTNITPTPLGSLSSQYESTGDIAALGYDSVGGRSYGEYQMIPSNAQKFVMEDPFLSSFFAGQIPGTAQFDRTWQRVAQAYPTQFKEAQHRFIEKTHYQPQVEKIKEQTGVDVSKFSDVLKDVIWSTAVQHGPKSLIVVNALKQLGAKAKEADLISKIYDLRWGGGSQFKSSTPEVKTAVQNRLKNEKAKALSLLQTNRYTA